MSWSALAWGCPDCPGAMPGFFIVLKHIDHVDVSLMGENPAKRGDRPLGKEDRQKDQCMYANG